MTEQEEEEAATTAAPSLPKLLSSLATGVRSVNNLPLATGELVKSKYYDDSDVEDGVGGGGCAEDEFSFCMSLPEFSTLNEEASRTLTRLLGEALEGLGEEDVAEEHELDDPELWERCADACDVLLDRVAAYVSSSAKGASKEDAAVAEVIGRAAEAARGKAAGAYGRMLRGIADMEKPQNVYQGFVTHPPQNERSEPFLPQLLDPRKAALLRAGDHPYQIEIQSLEYRPWQLSTNTQHNQDSPETQHNQESPETQETGAVWIDREEHLAELAGQISEAAARGDLREIAVDLEAHSHRSFAGFVCLIQLSVRQPIALADGGAGRDFLLDALALRHVVGAHLGPLLANPDILKVMHGADSDVPWLQRDFGCYIVNLFDTGRAARALNFPSAGLAYLLRRFAGLDPDKTHQLSDWRRRPLPDDMRRYAAADTRYLLSIYDTLRQRLGDDVKTVLDHSKRVCLIRYEKEPFRPTGYLAIIAGGKRKKGKVSVQLSPQQEATLKALYDWRDRTARTEDESPRYVCPDAVLLRIASNRPLAVSALLRLVNPLPPLVMRNTQQILDIVNNAAGKTTRPRLDQTLDSAKNSNATTKTPHHANKGNGREMLSPILGSDALYQQAGWMTPKSTLGKDSNAPEIITSDMEDDSDHSFLEVNFANRNFSSARTTSHSLEMSSCRSNADNNGPNEANATVSERSGRGIVVRCLDKTTVAQPTNAMGASIQNSDDNDDVRISQQSANFIQSQIMTDQPGNRLSLLDFIRPNPLTEKLCFETANQDAMRDANKDTNLKTKKDVTDNGTSDSNGNSKDANNGINELNAPIPKSMREIYDISNANRRRSAKEKAPPRLNDFLSNDTNIPQFKEDQIETASAVIASRGGPGGYFHGKRQRTDEKGDVALVTEMGWIQEQDAIATSANASARSETDRKKEKPGERREGGAVAAGKSGPSRGIGAFDPNVVSSYNPFFAGAATSAASMLNESRTQKRATKR